MTNNHCINTSKQHHRAVTRQRKFSSSWKKSKRIKFACTCVRARFGCCDIFMCVTSAWIEILIFYSRKIGIYYPSTSSALTYAVKYNNKIISWSIDNFTHKNSSRENIILFVCVKNTCWYTHNIRNHPKKREEKNVVEGNGLWMNTITMC